MTEEQFRLEINDHSVAKAVRYATAAGTAQLVIVRAGEIIVDEVLAVEPVDVYAVQKGLVSVMFGIAVERQLLDLDRPVRDYLGEGWTHLPATDEARLTIRHVLNMTTGMDNDLGPLGEVGVSWRYNNIAYNYLKTALEIVTGESLREITRAWLCEPLGMSSTQWVERAVLRPDGQPITGLASTAGDLAKFGAMVLSGGNDVVPSQYLQSLGRPGSQENPSWGLCWWNNNESHHRLPRSEAEVLDGALTPEAPADMIAARGAAENYLYVVPSLDIVVARTAIPTRNATPFNRPFWKLLGGG